MTQSLLRRIFLVGALAASIGLNVSTAALADEEDCNCTTEEQCAYGSCCFSAPSCGPDNKKCRVWKGTEGGKHCTFDGDDCTYQGGQCGSEGG